MITLITGVPGSGKSAALVDLLSRLAEGRALYVNGIPELKIAHVDLTDDQVKDWMTVCEDGSAIVIDEVQRLWPPARSTKPPEIAALEVHRHRGLDFFLVTQNPKLLHANVRALVGRHIHLRDVGLLGRWWYEWPECSEGIFWKSAPISKRYTLPKKAFGLYKSASLHIKPIRSFPRAVLVLALCIPIGGVFAYKVFERVASVNSQVVKDLPKLPDKTELPGFVLPKAEAFAPTKEEPKPLAIDRVAGCISTATRCLCVGLTGQSVTLDDQECRTASYTLGGIVPYVTETKRDTAVADAATPIQDQSDARGTERALVAEGRTVSSRPMP